MFQMTVKDAIKIHDNLVSVVGPCININEFCAGQLTDEYGNTYDAHVPLGKTLVFDDSSVMLGIYGAINIDALKGRTLAYIQ